MLAGEVTAILGAKVNPAGFLAYNNAVDKAVASATKAEIAQKRYDAALAKSNANMAMAGKVAKTGLVAGMLGVTAAIAGSVKKAADFEQQMSSLQAVTRANGTTMQKFKKQAMEAGAATKFSALEAAQAQTALAKGGLSTANIMKGGLKAALSLAAAGEMELATAAETTVNAMKQFGIDGSKAGHVADVLATAANATTVEVGDLARALTQGGGVAAMAGASLDETVASLEALADAGVRGSDAGTSLKSFFLNIATPSKQAKAAMKDLGMNIFTAKGELKTMPAVAQNLRQAFGDLTKEQFLNRAGIIAGSDAARALFAIYKAGPDGMRGYLSALKEQGTAAEMAAKKQDNLKGKLENLKGSLETAGIALGTKLLPALTVAAEQATEAINKAASDGSLDRFADGLISGGKTAVQVVGDVAGVVHELASDAASAARPVLALADALGAFSPTGIEAAVAAFAGFKVAQTIAPRIVALAASFKALQIAAAASNTKTLFALGPALAGAVNPMTAAAVAAGVLAAGLVVLASRDSAAEAAAKRHAQAVRDLKAALDELEGKTVDDADATDRSREADRKATEDRRAYTKAVAEHGKNSDQAKTALRESTRSTIEAARADRDATTATKDRVAAAEKSIRTARTEQAAARQRVKDLQTPVATAGKVGGAAPGRSGLSPQATRELEDANRKLAQANAEVALSELNKQRLLAGSPAIARKDAVAIDGLSQALKGVPKDVKTKILTEGSPKALTQLAAITAAAKGTPDEARIRAILSDAGPVKVKLAAVAALAKGVPNADIKAILTGGGSVTSQLGAIAQAVRDVPAYKTVTIAVQKVGDSISAIGDQLQGIKRASGRGPGGDEVALVGEGRHAREAVVDPARGSATMVDRPTLMGLSSSAYVIPEDPMQRGKSMGLLSMLAEDLGLRGFAASKKPAKRAKAAAAKKAPQPLGLPDPSKVQPTELPVAQMQDLETAARKKLNDATGKVHDLPEKIKSARKRVKDIRGRNAKTDATKAKKKRDLADAQDDLKKLQESLAANKKAVPKRRADWNDVKKDLAQARRFQAAITKTESLADIAANEMRLANLKGDAGAWNTAKGKRVDALRVLQQLLGNAAKITGKPNSQIAADIAKQLSDANVTAQELEGDKFSPDSQAADEALSDTERARLTELDRDAALAALTDPTGDDLSTAQAREGFLSGLLGAAQSSGRSAGVVGELATLVKQARDDVKSLQNDRTPDMQAQIDRQAQIIDLATRNAAANANALAVFAGSGDIGSGGGNAWRAATNITVNTLHPGSPDTLAAIAAASNAGNALQNGIQSSRLAVG